MLSVTEPSIVADVGTLCIDNETTCVYGLDFEIEGSYSKTLRLSP